MATLELYMAICVRREQAPCHWIILAVPPGSARCTYYHVNGGPSQGTDYALQIEAGKRTNSTGIATTELIGIINASDVNRLKASAQRPAPEFCQSWAVKVVEDIERKGLVAPGTAESWRARVETDPYAG